MRFSPSFLALLVGLAATAALCPAPARAHPHVFVAVKSDLVFDREGRVSAVRHAWTFDDMYSAFAVQGMGKDGVPSSEELQALAKINVEQLLEANFFTFIRAGGRRAEFGQATDYRITMDEKKLITLHFTAPLKEPASAGRAFVMQVYDPTYFVAFELEKNAPVRLTAAPQGCSLNILQPPPLAEDDARRLNDSMGTNVSPGSEFGIKLAARVVVACP